MPPSICLRNLSHPLLDGTAHTSAPSHLGRVQVACFSTTPNRMSLSAKKRFLAPAPKKGLKSLNVRKGMSAPSRDAARRLDPAEARAARKRIVLSNDNALEVSSLKDLSEANVLDEKNEGKVMGLPVGVVDLLRSVEAFKKTQGWSLFRRPAMLIRKETIQLMRLFREVETLVSNQEKKTIRRIISGDRMSGKSTLLLQGLTAGFLRGWFVINLPDALDITNAYTDYAPLPHSNPVLYTQDSYTSALLQQMLDSNRKFLESTKLTTNLDPAIPLTESDTLKDLVEFGTTNSENSWLVFITLWKELSQPERPPILLAIDGLSYIMRNSEYFSADVKPIHAHDLTLIRHFIDHLSGEKLLPNGGIVLAATSLSNAPTSPGLKFYLEVAEARQKSPEKIPEWNAHAKVDARVMDVLKDLKKDDGVFDMIKVAGLSKEEARSIMEYYAESGLLRHQVNDRFVSEKWSLAGMGNVGELERASVRARV